MGDAVQFGRASLKAWPGWRWRIDAAGVAHHEPIAPRHVDDFTLVPDGFDMRPGAINWVYQ